MQVKWTVPNTTWVGDDWGGKLIQLGPDFEYQGQVQCYLMGCNNVAKAVVATDDKIITVDVEELTIIQEGN